MIFHQVIYIVCAIFYCLQKRRTISFFISSYNCGVWKRWSWIFWAEKNRGKKTSCSFVEKNVLKKSPERWKKKPPDHFRFVPRKIITSFIHCISGEKEMLLKFWKWKYNMAHWFERWEVKWRKKNKNTQMLTEQKDSRKIMIVRVC